jgi:HEAT repeat protein
MSIFATTPDKIAKWVETRKVDKLVHALQSKDAVVCELATEGLAKIGGAEVLQYCRENARHSEQHMRWQITKILGLIGTPEAMKILETVEDPTDAIRRTAKKKA